MKLIGKCLPQLKKIKRTVGTSPQTRIHIFGEYQYVFHMLQTCLMLFSFSLFYKTFEAKIHHLETRLSRKSREGTAELEYFVRCEVHSSDLNTFISSIKRVAEDVRTTKEDKCKKLTKHSILIFDI